MNVHLLTNEQVSLRRTEKLGIYRTIFIFDTDKEKKVSQTKTGDKMFSCINCKSKDQGSQSALLDEMRKWDWIRFFWDIFFKLLETRVKDKASVVAVLWISLTRNSSQGLFCFTARLLENFCYFFKYNSSIFVHDNLRINFLIEYIPIFSLRENSCDYNPLWSDWFIDSVNIILAKYYQT